MTTYTARTVNTLGLVQIAKFIGENTHHGKVDQEALRAWARDAEFQMGEGNTPTIEISHIASIHGVTQEFTIDANGIDSEEVEINE